jgi:sulfite reductase alpha subunit-like flavoprotein
MRRADESCLGAATRVIHARSALEAEAWGFEVVTRTIDSYNGQQIIIEMDSMVVVTTVHRREYSRAYWGSIIRIRGNNRMFSLPNVSLRWIRRAGNSVAHHLARWAFSEPDKDWTSSVPPIL